MQQRTFDFDVVIKPPEKLQQKEPELVAEVTSLPPPPLVRPDRQIVYECEHSEWPEPAELHDQVTITVDRIRDDIDGPAHRFVIRRGDTVEAHLSPNRFHTGQVIGISHARNEVRVAWDDTLQNGEWFNVGAIYPAPETKPNRLTNGIPLSEIITELNSEHQPDGGWHEADRVPHEVPYTFAEFKEIWKTRDRDLTYQEYQTTFERIVESEEAIHSELGSTYKAPQLKAIAHNLGDFSARSNTKAANAKSIYRKMLSFFLLDGSVSFGMGESYTAAVKAKVRGVTEEAYEAHHKEFAEKEAERKEALANPQTLYDFQRFIEAKGEAALTGEQMALWDALHADLARERRAASGPAATVTQFESEELGQVEFTIKQGYHEKRECPLWIVQLGSRVTAPTFKELKTKATMLGGWYSSFKKSDAGFQFLSEESANKFTKLLEGDADRQEILVGRKERKDQTAAERLHELADNLLARAEETLAASEASLQNTARRADIQAGVRGKAYADQALARSLHSVANVLSTGAAKYLDGIRHKTHLETLDTVLSLAKWARIRAIRKAENDHEYGYGLRVQEEEEKPYSEEDIRFAEYPYPSIYRRHLEEAIGYCLVKNGCKQAAAKLAKTVRRLPGEFLEFIHSHDIEQLTDFLSRAKSVGFDTTWLDERLEKHHRLQRAHIDDLHTLRAALREYLPHKASTRGDDPIRVAERELIGKDLPGFFPTPRAVIEQMLDYAQIQPQHTVLEPSCGKGDIVEALRQTIPAAQISALEKNRTLAEVLAAKAIEVEFTDFLEHNRQYDRIVQNPPFESGQDIDHVRHALACLTPGGRLVSVMCEGPFFRNDTKSTEFRAWLHEIAGESYELPADAFRATDAFRQTGVKTRIVVIDKD
ncbi:methyltransferase [Bythopirellula goksoeyrii]|uniref:Methyltransferase small domain protein n=1 Tax=Bythopirellula goksoeyrii TaxID=1400387 RepID=A0A5B9QEH9_9BACT|nr:methyltransferase [Bythopirellula goksoeyrii]QEG35902.1 Methyltransferase small domain protein [Bythopirellula goksoeyrii]